MRILSLGYHPPEFSVSLVQCDTRPKATPKRIVQSCQTSANKRLERPDESLHASQLRLNRLTREPSSSLNTAQLLLNPLCSSLAPIAYVEPV